MRKHLVLVGILGLGIGLAGFAQQSQKKFQVSRVSRRTPIRLSSGHTHLMGPSCQGFDDTICHLTVASIRADEKNPSHSAVNLSTDKQDSLHISGEKPFTVEFVSDDNGPAPFYRPMGKPSKVFASGPAREEARGHHYHMVIRDEEGATDPHICIGGGGSSC